MVSYFQSLLNQARTGSKVRESGKEGGGGGGERGRKERKEKGNERGYIHRKKRFLLFGIARECPD